ncbi:MAG TPA: hypothetical protein VGP80_13830 [Gemmatimonadales bacterium]|nr:hypothetical protein [Gemmatimonadales bacterium]
MRTKIFQVDPFATRRFAGNSAAVCRMVGDRVDLEGTCVFYLEGEIEI